MINHLWNWNLQSAATMVILIKTHYFSYVPHRPPQTPAPIALNTWQSLQMQSTAISLSDTWIAVTFIQHVECHVFAIHFKTNNTFQMYKLWLIEFSRSVTWDCLLQELWQKIKILELTCCYDLCHYNNCIFFKGMRKTQFLPVCFENSLKVQLRSFSDVYCSKTLQAFLTSELCNYKVINKSLILRDASISAMTRLCWSITQIRSLLCRQSNNSNRCKM